VSEPIFEASVRLRVDDSEFAQQGEAQVQARAEDIEKQFAAQHKAVLDDAISKAQATQRVFQQTQTELRQALAREREIEAVRRASSDPAVFARSFYAEELPVLQKRIQELQRTVIIQRELNAETQRGVRQALRAPVVPPTAEGAAGPIGIGTRVREFLAQPGLNRGGGAGSLIGVGARLGLAGFAASAVFQTFGEVNRLLRVTGEEAFTVQGRFRNLGAELMTGNLIGAFKALTADRPAEFSSGVTAALKAEKDATNDFLVTEEKLIAKRRESKEASDQYIGVLLAIGAINVDTALKLRKVSDELLSQENRALATADALGFVARRIREAGQEAAAFGERGGLGGVRGPGGVGLEQPGAQIGFQRTGIPRPIFSPDTGGTFKSPTEESRRVAQEIRESITKRIEDDKKRLELEIANARVIQQQARATFENVRGGDEAAAAWRDFVVATTGVTLAVQAAKNAAIANAEAAQELGNAVRDATIANIVDPDAQRAATLRAAKIEEGQAKRAFDEAEKGTKEANEAYGKWKIAQQKTVGAQNEITAAAKESAKLAAEEAEAAAQSNASARAQSLENQIAKAALTKRKSDDKAAFDAAIDYWRGIAASAKNAEAREEAEAKVIDLRKRRKEALTGESADPTRDIELLRIENRVAAARLTTSTLDDKKFVNQLVAYWKEKVRDAEGYEKEVARSRLIAAQLQKQALSKQSGEDSPEVFVRKLFERAADEFRQFGSNISGSANGILAPQDARGAFAASIAGNRFGVSGYDDRIQREQLTEQQKQTAILRGIQTNTGVPPKKAPLAPEESRVQVEIGSSVLRGM